MSTNSAGNWNIESRLCRIEDELAIRNLAARFSDAIARLDYEEFRSLWSPHAIWEITEPRHFLANGVDDIVALLRYLLDGRDFFVQLTHSGVIELSGDQAIARWVMRERGRGPGKVFYDNFAVYVDAVAKVDGLWRFTRRTYHYVFLDESEFTGSSFPQPS